MRTIHPEPGRRIKLMKAVTDPQWAEQGIDSVLLEHVYVDEYYLYSTVLGLSELQAALRIRLTRTFGRGEVVITAADMQWSRERQAYVYSVAGYHRPPGYALATW